MKNRFCAEISAEHILKLLDAVGMEPAEFRKQYWGKKHMTIAYFNRSGKLSLPSLIKICDILQLTPNDVLQMSDKDLSVLRTVREETTSELASALDGLNLDIKQKDSEITALKDKVAYLEQSLKEKQEIINYLIKPGQNSDTE